MRQHGFRKQGRSHKNNNHVCILSHRHGLVCRRCITGAAVPSPTSGLGITHKSKTRRDLTSGPKGPTTTARGKRCLPKAGEASPRDSDAVYAPISVGAREETLAWRAMRAFVFDHSHSRALSELSTNDAPATRGDARPSTSLRASLAPGFHSRARWARCQVPSTCRPRFVGNGKPNGGGVIQDSAGSDCFLHAGQQPAEVWLHVFPRANVCWVSRVLSDYCFHRFLREVGSVTDFPCRAAPSKPVTVPR